MKRIRNIKKKQDFDIDHLLSANNLNYSDINFDNSDSDILKSYYSINKKLNSKSFSFKNIIPNFNYTLILKPAYTIVLTTIVIIAVIHFKNVTKPAQFADIYVDKGEKITLHVTENLTIYLNSESSIKIPLELKSNSEIILNGEAYFEIASKNNIKIIANGILFESKNSDFYINSKKQDQITAQIFNGTVESYNPKLPKSTRFNLEENSKLSYNRIAEFISVEQANNKNVIAWHTRNLSFNEESLQSVVNEISNCFEIPIEIQNEDLNSQLYTAHFNNLEIDKILDNIQFTFNCNISTDGSKIIIN